MKLHPQHQYLNYLFYLFFLLIFFAVINGKKKSKKSESNENTELRTCDGCRSEIPKHDKICPICGVDSSKTVECDYYGHQNKMGSIICEKCNGLIA